MNNRDELKDKKESIKEILKELKSHANPTYVEGMARFGINSKGTFGVSIPTLRSIAKRIGKNHELAQELWDSRIHEARLLACMIDVPQCVTEKQMEKWVFEFDSWDICDQTCSNLFDKTPFAYEKALGWSDKKEEFVKRAGFVMMAALSVHDKKADDSKFVKFLSIIIKEAHDERNFVKKAVNWALRQIGKRNTILNKRAIEIAEKIKSIDSSSAKWIASDALRELKSKSVQSRINRNC